MGRPWDEAHMSCIDHGAVVGFQLVMGIFDIPMDGFSRDTRGSLCCGWSDKSIESGC